RARGNMSMDTQVATTGDSPAELIFDLHGQGKASGENFVFEGFDLARLSRTLAQPSSSMKENFTGLLNNAMAGGTTSFDKLAADFVISQGVITFSELALTGKQANVTSTGNINLPLWTIDMD